MPRPGEGDRGRTCRRLFENKYGEKRQAKIIRWNKGEVKAALRSGGRRRKGDTEFDRIARTQADPNLAAAAGQTQPVGRNAYDDSQGKQDEVERVLFSLKVGEISQLFQTPRPASCA